jgi:hypothetical protein
MQYSYRPVKLNTKHNYAIRVNVFRGWGAERLTPGTDTYRSIEPGRPFSGRYPIITSGRKSLIHLNLMGLVYNYI